MEVVAALSLGVLANYSPDLMESQFFVVLGWTLALLLWSSRALPRPLLLFALYVGLQACWYATFAPVPPIVRALVLRHSLMLGALVLLGGVLGERLSRWNGICCAAGVATVLGYPPLPHNASLNAALLVAMLPLCSGPWAVGNALLAVAVAAFWQGGTTALLMLLALAGIVCGEHMRARRGLRWEVAAVAALAVSGVVLGVVAWKFPHLLQDESRVDFYRAAWRYWDGFDLRSQLLGVGLGTFVLHGPGIQKLATIHTPERWATLHSDFAQLAFELGLVGLVLGLLLFLRCALSGTREGRALLLMGICALFYFPMEVPLMALFCVVMTMRALRVTFHVEHGGRK